MFDFLSILIFSLVVFFCLSIFFYYEKDWTSPIFLILTWILIFIVGDAWYSYFSNSYGPGEYNRYSLYAHQIGLISISWTLSTLIMSIGYIVGSRNFSTISIHDKFKKNSTVSSKKNIDLDIRRLSSASIVVKVCFILTLLSLYFISMKGIELGYNLTEISQIRNYLFSDGGGYLLIIVQLYKYSILFWLFYKIKSIKFSNQKINGFILMFSIVLALLIDLFLGTRSSFVYGFLLPMLILLHTEYKAIKIRTLSIIAMFIFVFVGIIYRTVARDQYFVANKGGNLGDLILSNLKEAPQFFWGGFEASSLDGIIDIVEKVNFSSNFLLGQTIIDGLTAPVPRFLYEEKARGGANYVYTSTYYPEFYGAIRSEYSASFMGELYLNGGFYLVLLGFFTLGIILGVLRSISKKYVSTVFIVFYGIIISRIYSLLRGDLFNFVGQLSISIITLVIVFSLVGLIDRVKLREKVIR